jgi:hypothetical protein
MRRRAPPGGGRPTAPGLSRGGLTQSGEKIKKRGMTRAQNLCIIICG